MRGWAFRVDPNRGCGGEGTLWGHTFGMKSPGVPPNLTGVEIEFG